MYTLIINIPKNEIETPSYRTGDLYNLLVNRNITSETDNETASGSRHLYYRFEDPYIKLLFQRESLYSIVRLILFFKGYSYKIESADFNFKHWSCYMTVKIERLK